MRQTTIASQRLEGLDIARGVAIALMFLSHTVKGLLPLDMIPPFGVVPIHLITKFSSSLFIIVFGVTAAIRYVDRVDTPEWPALQVKLIKRALLILLWYKILIVVQMFQRYNRWKILEALLWQRFPDFVEILQFYGWFMLLMPFFLGAWRTLPLWSKFLAAYAVGLVSYLLQTYCDFWGVWQLKAILVEYPRVFCFGVLTRGSMVLFAMALGEVLRRGDDRRRQAKKLAAICAVMGTAMLVAFFALYWDSFDALLRNMADNQGKHPPTIPFLLFSGGGALVSLGLLLPVRGMTGQVLTPFRLIGREALLCFNLHIIVIFIFYRYLFDMRHTVSYAQALWATLGVFLLAVIAAAANMRRKRLTVDAETTGEGGYAVQMLERIFRRSAVPLRDQPGARRMRL
jgi:hypothetical protein